MARYCVQFRTGVPLGYIRLSDLGMKSVSRLLSYQPNHRPTGVKNAPKGRNRKTQPQLPLIISPPNAKPPYPLSPIPYSLPTNLTLTSSPTANVTGLPAHLLLNLFSTSSLLSPLFPAPPSIPTPSPPPSSNRYLLNTTAKKHTNSACANFLPIHARAPSEKVMNVPFAGGVSSAGRVLLPGSASVSSAGGSGEGGGGERGS